MFSMASSALPIPWAVPVPGPGPSVAVEDEAREEGEVKLGRVTGGEGREEDGTGDGGGKEGKGRVEGEEDARGCG